MLKSLVLIFASTALAQITSSSLEKHVDALTLSANFNPVKEAYWTGFPHHRRTPFAVSICHVVRENSNG